MFITHDVNVGHYKLFFYQLVTWCGLEMLNLFAIEGCITDSYSTRGYQ